MVRSDDFYEALDYGESNKCHNLLLRPQGKQAEREPLPVLPRRNCPTHDPTKCRTLASVA